MSPFHAYLMMDGGVEAWKALNNEIQRDPAKGTAWYGKNVNDFTSKSSRWRSSIVISNAFKIRAEDWLLAIKECIPVCHTWYRSREANQGECSWLLIYRTLKDRIGKQSILDELCSEFTLLSIMSGRPAAHVDL